MKQVTTFFSIKHDQKSQCEKRHSHTDRENMKKSLKNPNRDKRVVEKDFRRHSYLKQASSRL